MAPEYCCIARAGTSARPQSNWVVSRLEDGVHHKNQTKMRVLVLMMLVGCHESNSAPLDQRASVCDAGWIASGNECFYLGLDTVTSWSDAQSRCLSMNGDLATPADNADSIAMLMTGVSEAGQSKFWLGQSTDEDGGEGNDLPSPTGSGNTQCNFIEHRGSQEISFDTMDCDTPNAGFMCIKNPRAPATQQTTSHEVRMTVTSFPRMLPTPVSPMGSTSAMPDDSTDDSTEDESGELQPGSSRMLANPGPFLAQLVQGVVEPVCRENWIMDTSGTKCYFVAPVFDSGSFFETTEFCESLGSSLVQPRSLEELKAVDDIVHNITTWTQGPWLGLIRPFGDARVVRASTGMSLPDPDLSSALATLISSNDTTSNCAGYSQGPNAPLDFFSCHMEGNPFCEMPVLYEFLPINSTVYMGDSTTNSTDSAEDMSTPATTSAPVEPDEGEDD